MKHILIREHFLIRESVASDVQDVKALVAKHTEGAEQNELVGILLQLLEVKDFEKIDRDLAKQNQEVLQEAGIAEITALVGTILNTAGNSVVILDWLLDMINSKLNLHLDKEKIVIQLGQTLDNIIKKSSSIFFKILDKIFDFICDIFGISMKWEKAFEYGVLSVIATIFMIISIVQFPESSFILQLISVVSLIIQSAEMKALFKDTIQIFINLKNGVTVRTISDELKKEFIGVLKIDLPG